MTSYPNKYNLTSEQSAFLAKKKWDENVYCGMKMENRNITFPQTKTILDGVNVPNVQLDDIQAVLNMRDAWRHLLNTINEPVTLDYMCKLNEYIARNEALEWGKLRTGRVGISGTDYTPPVPDADKAAEELNAIIEANTTTTDKALSVFAWGARSQLFWDGNKRTSLVLANKILLAGGAGMLTIDEKNMEQFNMLLVSYYNTGESEKLKRFLYDSAIRGIDIFNPQQYAVSIEHLGHFPLHSADEIRRNPIGYLDANIMDSLENTSDTCREAVCAFWDKYRKYSGICMDNIEETIVREIVYDFRELLKIGKP